MLRLASVLPRIITAARSRRPCQQAVQIPARNTCIGYWSSSEFARLN